VEQSTGKIVNKADPYALHTETAPDNASKLYESVYYWQDSEWLEKRAGYLPYNAPINIYEVHLGSWKRYADGNCLDYRSLADELIPYVKKMHYTHIELMPVTEYPFEGSWGYQVSGMFAPTSRYGTPDDFRYFIDKCHLAGIGVIVDWVASHFPKDEFGLFRFDGAPLYEYGDITKREHPEWGTVVFDYGRNEVKSFLISSAMFWFESYHIDGIRVDAVASMLYLDYARKAGEWIPNVKGGNYNLEAIQFLRELNTAVLSEYKGALMIAEESTAFEGVTKPPYEGGLGFNFKWNMGWMNDTLKYVAADPYFRKELHGKMTFSIMYAFNENYILPLSHDEVVHGKASLVNKMPGYYTDKFAGLMTYYGYMMAHPGKKLFFMGGEFAQFIEWNYKQGLDWLLLDYPAHSGVKKFVADLNKLYVSERALYSMDTSYEGFRWICVEDKGHNLFALKRIADNGEYIIAVMNFSPMRWDNYYIGVPEKKTYTAILDSTRTKYSNGPTEKTRKYKAVEGSVHGEPYHIEMDILPNSVIFLKALYGRRATE
jgi:1,4-alpha-glucan branching enzyme